MDAALLEQAIIDAEVARGRATAASVAVQFESDYVRELVSLAGEALLLASDALADVRRLLAAEG